MTLMLEPDASYVFLPRRSLGRYVLSYEVMSLSLCYLVNGKHLVSSNDVHMLWQSGVLKETDCMLEFTSPLDSKENYLSLSELSNVWFSSESELSRFLERSYENFDVTKLSCRIFPPLEQSDSEEVVLSAPDSVDQQQFFEIMSGVDGLLSLLHEKLAATHDSADLIIPLSEVLSDEQGLLRFALNLDGLELKNGQVELAKSFLKLCSHNGLTQGWVPTDVMEQLKSDIPPSVKNGKAFIRWEDNVNKLLGYDIDAFPFTDEDGYIVHKSIALTLMNPEVEALESMRSALGDQIGIQVYELSRLFALARAGYSMLADAEREVIGANNRINSSENQCLAAQP